MGDNASLTPLNAHISSGKQAVISAVCSEVLKLGKANFTKGHIVS